ncbi:MAG: hypothetical protein PHC44_01575 [Lutispora sp.]|nr:hypothetical protein [Lutispora sp.]
MNGKPFTIFNNVKDKIDALKERMRPHVYLLVFIIFMELYIKLIGEPLFNISYLSNRNSVFQGNATLPMLLGLIGIGSIVRIVQLSLSIKSLKEKGDIHE